MCWGKIQSGAVLYTYFPLFSFILQLTIIYLIMVSSLHRFGGK